MASSTLLTSLLKSTQVGRITKHPIVLLASSGRRIHVTQKTKDVAGKASETAQGAAEKAKQTAEDVLVSTKEAAQKAKDTVLNRAEVSKEYVKENAEKVKKSMNSKE
ncbi:Late embryogenesis abundant protein (LEA) family protein [Parasponia andersonii]|uniref:Late embryogenesis abundant protein (LEA) family protein n=1 Tax=Parasponia andersonii TaxID=3476 RepID=A0A2P5B9M3_PARAD|nr:Late embryogenesis abundant protein (LEA) family protein [Parasponia andersonii]